MKTGRLFVAFPMKVGASEVDVPLNQIHEDIGRIMEKTRGKMMKIKEVARLLET